MIFATSGTYVMSLVNSLTGAINNSIHVPESAEPACPYAVGSGYAVDALPAPVSKS